MNKYQYTASTAERSIVTKFLGTDAWVKFLDKNPADFVRGVLEIYKNQLRKLDYLTGSREVVIHAQNRTPLYLLVFASRNQLGVAFWDKTMKGVQQPEFPLNV